MSHKDHKEMIANPLWVGRVLAIVVFALTPVWAQDTSGQQPADTTSQQPADATSQQPAQTPVPAFGQDTNQEPTTQFPPLSGLDEASLEPNIAPRSMLVSSFQASEVADSNATDRLNQGGGGHHFIGSTRLAGSFALQRLWSHYQLTTQYTGAGALYTGAGRQGSQMHSINLDAKTLWRTGALAIRDSASYLPEGTFGGGAFGGVGSVGGGLGGVGGGGLGGGFGGGGGAGFFGAGSLASLGNTPRLINRTIVDVQQRLDPRNAITLAGGYSFVHFTRSTGGLLIESRQISGQAGFNHVLSRRNTIAVVYGYGNFHFPGVGAGSFQSHVIHMVFGHQVSGRMDLRLGAGPQVSQLHSSLTGNHTRVSASANVTLRYRFPKTTVGLSYSRYDTAGSGLVAGATSDIVRGTISRPLSARWSIGSDLGFTHNVRLLDSTSGVNTKSFNSGYAGARLTRMFTRTIHGFLFYHFNEVDLGQSFCGASGPCNHLSTRHVAGVGVSWQPHPIRLD